MVRSSLPSLAKLHQRNLPDASSGCERKGLWQKHHPLALWDPLYPSCPSSLRPQAGVVTQQELPVIHLSLPYPALSAPKALWSPNTPWRLQRCCPSFPRERQGAVAWAPTWRQPGSPQALSLRPQVRATRLRRIPMRVQMSSSSPTSSLIVSFPRPGQRHIPHLVIVVIPVIPS